MALVRRALMVAAGLVVLTAPPALAHALNGAAPSNYRTRILDVEPELPGISVEVVEAGNRLLLTNTGEQEAIVLGYAQEPYLRVGPEGVFENLRSPATYRNRSRFPTDEVPAKAQNPQATPEWSKVSDDNNVRFHDHRVHYMGLQPPGPVRAAPNQEHVIIPAWEVPIEVGDEKILVKGDLAWIPGPSSMPWLGIAAVLGLALVGLALGPGGKQPKLATVLVVAALAALVVLDVARLAGLASNVGSSLGKAAGQNLQAVAGWITAVAAAALLLRGDTRAGPALAAGAGALFALGSFGDIDILSSSQVASDAPMWLMRLSVASGLGLGLGLLVVAFVPLIYQSGPAPAAAGSPEPVPAD
ncbi:MAG: hypothetical protein ACRDZ3_15270 [Acidimicrobiia bacterium]